MKTLLKSALCLAVTLLVVPTASAQDKKVDPNGKWTWTTEGRNGQTRTNSVTLKLDGEKLTGTVTGFRGRGGGGGAPQDTAIEDAKIAGNEVSFKVTREFNGNSFVSKYSAKIAGDTMKGKMIFDRGGETMEREFEAKREAAKK
jgi:hypothetical protein